MGSLIPKYNLLYDEVWGNFLMTSTHALNTCCSEDIKVLKKRLKRRFFEITHSDSTLKQNFQTTKVINSSQTLHNSSCKQITVSSFQQKPEVGIIPTDAPHHKYLIVLLRILDSEIPFFLSPSFVSVSARLVTAYVFWYPSAIADEKIERKQQFLFQQIYYFQSIIVAK